MAFGRKKGSTTTSGDLWKTAEHPGYKNRKQAVRGGTRRAAVREAVQEAITRNPQPKTPLVKNRKQGK